MKTRIFGVRLVSLIRLVLVLSGIPVITLAVSPEDLALLRRTSSAFAAVAREAIPAVVSIRVEKTVETFQRVTPFQFNNPFDFFGDDFLRRFFPDYQLYYPRQFRLGGQGSGFLISKDGYILTNNHVVGDADRIRVRLHDGREFDAKRIGSDPKSEVAVIKIEGDNFPYLQMGDSSALEVGELVIAIGNPFGLNETVTVGVVSAKGRTDVRVAEMEYQDFIQTDAAINPGNSGGPLLNIKGEVVGINTAIFTQSGGYQGIGFAIPINLANAVREQLVRTGRVTRGYLGVILQQITPELAESFGLGEEVKGILVADVERGSPADRAGIQQADIILKLNGEDVGSLQSFRNQIAMTSPGREIVLTVRRDQRLLDLKVRVGTMPGESESEATAADIYEQSGLTVQELDRETAERYGYELNEGVLVSAVKPNSWAALAGIRPGSLISSVNRKHVANVSEFKEALRNAKDSKSVLIRVKEGQFSRYLVLRLR